MQTCSLARPYAYQSSKGLVFKDLVKFVKVFMFYCFCIFCFAFYLCSQFIFLSVCFNKGYITTQCVSAMTIIVTSQRV